MRDHDGLSFPVEEYERRLRELRERMVRRRLDVFMITDPENLYYLTGYQTTGYSYFQALVVPVDGEPFMVTRLLEDSNVWARTWVELSRPYGDTGDAIQTVWHALVEFGLATKTIGYEKNSYFFPAYQQERFNASLMDAKLHDASGIVEEGRIVKSDLEIEMMKRAAVATEAGMAAGIEATAEGVTENDIAAAVHYAMFKAGGEYPAVAPYITSGPRTMIGHATWEGRKINRGDQVFLEIGGCVRRYHTALMRTVQLGDPSPGLREAEELVRHALTDIKAAMTPGLLAGEVDSVARHILDRNTSGASLVTRCGYMIGIAFAPSWDEGYILSLKPGEETVLEENMTFHLIPWLMKVDGDKVMALSDTVRVTDGGAQSFFESEPVMTVK
jgi:Xaa-Pro dipeptidase